MSEQPKKEVAPKKTVELKKERAEVITVRNWKEYLGESLLIIFSVILALALTEWFSKLHEEKQTHEIIRQLKQELMDNRANELDQFQYQQKIVRRIDSALAHPEFAQQFLHESKLNVTVIIDSGVLRHDLDNVAWQVAKQNNVFSHLDFSTYSLLTEIYDNQERIQKSEGEIGTLLLSRESRKSENLRETLILLRDNYYGWAMERAPRLLRWYDEAIEKLKDY